MNKLEGVQVCKMNRNTSLLLKKYNKGKINVINV